MIKERVQKWDILKFILILSVVFGHLLDFHTGESEKIRSLFLIIYSFHMPLFLFVSGLFSKGTISGKKFEKILSYLVLYIVAKIVDWSYFYIFAKSYEIDLFSAGGLPWFMFVLFAYPLITIGIKDVSPRYVLIWWVILACVAGYDSGIGDFLSLSRLIVYYPFYYLGYCVDANWLKVHCRNLKRKIAAGSLLCLFVISVLIIGDKIYFLRYFFTGRNSYSSIGEMYVPYGFVLRLFCYIVSFVIGYCIIILTPDQLGNGRIAKLGQNTLAVYMFHFPVLYLLYNQFQIEKFYEWILPGHPNLFIIPLSFIVTISLSNEWLTKLLNRVSKIPMK